MIAMNMRQKQDKILGFALYAEVFQKGRLWRGKTHEDGCGGEIRQKLTDFVAEKGTGFFSDRFVVRLFSALQKHTFSSPYESK